MKVIVDRINPSGVHIRKDEEYGKYSGAFIPKDVFNKISDKSFDEVANDPGPKDKDKIVKVVNLGDAKPEKKSSKVKDAEVEE